MIGAPAIPLSGVMPVTTTVPENKLEDPSGVVEAALNRVLLEELGRPSRGIDEFAVAGGVRS